jgi:hypothetical protein
MLEIQITVKYMNWMKVLFIKIVFKKEPFNYCIKSH